MNALGDFKAANPPTPTPRDLPYARSDGRRIYTAEGQQTAVKIIVGLPESNASSVSTSFTVYVDRDAASLSIESAFHKRTAGLDDRWKELADRTARPDWGNENEQAITIADWKWAQDFSKRFHGTPPFPAPCGDGSVHLTWHGRNKSRLVIEHKGQRTFYSRRDTSGEYTTAELASTDQAIEFVRGFLT
jgi:hypothetical protein